jgi:hypothetical protein
MIAPAFRIAATFLLAISLSNLADAKPGDRGGGAPHAGGAPRGGGAPHVGGGPGGGGTPHVGGGPRGGMHFAVPHGGPRMGAARSFAAPRSRSASQPRFSRVARPAFRGPALARHAARPAFTARVSRRSVLDRRGVTRQSLRGVTPLRGVTRQSLSTRTTSSLRSARVNARADSPRTSTAALGAFSGRNARANVGRALRDPALFAHHRFDPAFLRRVGFAGAFWPGPYFWPYAYYDETFWLWPSAYDEVFWAYGYDDILSGIYRPYAFSDYGDFVASIGGRGRDKGRRSASLSAPGSFTELCGAAAPGLTEWPVDEIAAAVEPTSQQRALLDALITASDKAAETLRAACPRNVPVTPIGRMDVMERQLAALEQAAQIVQPALEKFYAALSDDQKERFNALGPKSRTGRRRAGGETVPQPDRLARACQTSASEPADWPIARIEQAVRPDGRQRAVLNALQAATAEAARALQSACPADELPLTPTGRLSVVAQRIAAMRQSVATLRPALAKFYAALTDEQKARFNRALAGDRRNG